MKQAAILALATAVPPQSHSQEDIYARLEPFFGLNGRAQAIFRHAGVARRHTVVDADYYRQERRTAERNERYIAEAVPLGAETITRCLADAGLPVTAVDDLIVVSCTGIDTPGLDLRLAGRLGMRPDLRRTAVLGMGCYGALPGLLRAQQSVLAQPGRKAMVLAVELCSLHFQPENRTLENIVSSALFADGAAALLLGTGEDGAPGLRLLDTHTYCDYTTFEHMAFQLTDHGFRMRLSAYVPDLLAAEVESVVDGLLGRNGLSRDGVRFWIVHPGGSKILDHVQERLRLSDEAMQFSRAVLHDYGNMSSPTVLFVLDAVRRCGAPQPGDYGVMMAFGPGLTMESALVRW